MKSNFSDRFQLLIDSKKMSQADASRALGFTEGMVSNFLSGKTKNPIRKTILKIAEYFECDAEWLSTGEGEPFPDPTHQAVDKWLATEDRGPSELSEHERAIAMERLVQVGKKRWATTDTQGDSDQGEIHEGELISMTINVLRSHTVYRQALAANIRAFNQAVEGEIEMDDMRKSMERMEQGMDEMREMMRQLLENQKPEKNGLATIYRLDAWVANRNCNVKN